MIKVLRVVIFSERFAIVLYRADTIGPKSVHKLSTDLYGFWLALRVEFDQSAKQKTASDAFTYTRPALEQSYALQRRKHYCNGGRLDRTTEARQRHCKLKM
jgi:hypothetical protein